MLQWFRARAPYIAALAIATLAGAGGASIAPHEDDCHEGACAIVQHDASAHRIGAATGASGEHHHCLVCHLGRAFRLRTEARVLPSPVTETRQLVHVEYVTVAASAPVAQPPLRSPPPSFPGLS